MSITPLEAVPIETLRERSSTKWRKFDHDVLPMFVAEHDFPLAPGITAALTAAVERGDTGYTPPAPGVRESFVEFALRRQGWTVDPAHVFWTADVMMGVVEILRAVTSPGDRVVIMPPVYAPFFDTVREAGAEVEEVPLERTAEGWRIDLDGVGRALERGARAVLLCNPHNPTGTVHAKADLAHLADLAAAHGAVVVSDEIHAPLTHDPHVFTPFLAASETAAEVGYAVTSASKTYNLAGLKCAVMVAGSGRAAAVLRALPEEVEWRTGLFGAIAQIAAFAPQSDAWLDSLRVALDANRRLLGALLREHLPEAGYVLPEAGYLGWIDLSAYGWGDDPGRRILKEAKVATTYGLFFGAEGRGHTRVNFGCSPEMLREAIERIATLARP